jgi:hypothetical protein
LPASLCRLCRRVLSVQTYRSATAGPSCPGAGCRASAAPAAAGTYHASREHRTLRSPLLWSLPNTHIVHSARHGTGNGACFSGGSCTQVDLCDFASCMLRRDPALRPRCLQTSTSSVNTTRKSCAFLVMTAHTGTGVLVSKAKKRSGAMLCTHVFLCLTKGD